MPLHFCWESLFSAPFTTGEIDIRALIVVCRYLGDVLLATPLARSLVQAGYTVDWLVSSGTQEMLQAQTCAHTVYTIDAAMSWRRQLALGIHLWRKYDAAFVLTASDRPMSLALAAAKQVYALIPSEGKQHAWKRYMSSDWISYEDKQHMVWRAMHLGKKMGLPTTSTDVGIEWTDHDTQQVWRQLPWGKTDAYIHIHPFARWAYKWWNKNSWRALINFILNQGLRVVITASPKEKEQAHDLAESYDQHKVYVLAGTLNWQQLACLSSQAAVYVGLDTANTHLAASTGTSVVALFGATDPCIWGPWPHAFNGKQPWQNRSEHGIQRSNNISLLQGTQDCIPCQLEGCDKHPQSDSACLQSIDVQRVWQAVQNSLECRE